MTSSSGCCDDGRRDGLASFQVHQRCDLPADVNEAHFLVARTSAFCRNTDHQRDPLHPLLSTAMVPDSAESIPISQQSNQVRRPIGGHRIHELLVMCLRPLLERLALVCEV